MAGSRRREMSGYTDGPDVNLRVGVLRIGDVHFVGINGELCTNISLGVKKASPASDL